ncbi:MAG: hypothetical protein ACKO3V_17985, partial [Pirellula sp.]
DLVRTGLPSFCTRVLGRLTRQIEKACLGAIPQDAVGNKLNGKKTDVRKESGIRTVGVWAD